MECSYPYSHDGCGDIRQDAQFEQVFWFRQAPAQLAGIATNVPSLSAAQLLPLDYGGIMAHIREVMLILPPTHAMFSRRLILRIHRPLLYPIP